MRIAAALIGLVLALVFAELVARVYGYFFVSRLEVFRLTNFAVDMNVSLLGQTIYPARPDPLLGHIPVPGTYRGRDETVVTILDDTLRWNGPHELSPGGAPILAVGDSFTYGDQVSDAETWPASLERLLDRPVLNAGVFGYGIDQSVLRAEQVAALRHPDMVILSVISDDIDRTEARARTGVAKPYFDVGESNQLVLHEAGETATELESARLRTAQWSLQAARALLGYSFLVHEAMFTLFPETWLSNRLTLSAHSNGDAVSCLLLQRLRRLEAGRILLLAQYTPPAVISDSRGDRMEKLLRCAEDAHLEVVDSFPALRALFEGDKAAFVALYRGHMSPEGNDLTASLLAEHLR